MEIRRTGPTIVAACALLFGCGNTTGGELTATPFLVGGCEVCTTSAVPRTDATAPFVFRNQIGWTVTLRTALVDLGPFYFNAYAPDSTSFMSGTIIFEVPTQVVVNVLDPTLYEVKGGAAGETGTSVAVQIGLLSPDVTVPLGLASFINGTSNGGVGYVAGTATSELPDGHTSVVDFSGQILISQELASPAMPLPYWQRVPGAGVNLDFTPASQTLELRVDPTHWFDKVNFGTAAMASGDAGPPTTCADSDAGMSAGDGGTCASIVSGWTVGTTINQTLAQGLETASGSYAFTLVSGGAPPQTPTLYSNIPDGGT